MGVFSFFKKKKSDDDTKEEKGTLAEMAAGVDTSKMSLKEKMAFKMFQRLSPDKQQDVLRKAMNPQTIQKNKAQILKQIDDMVKSGQIDKGQAEAIKSQMGLR